MRILYLTAILFFTLSSCAKWLDVTPKDIVIEGEMFKNGEGYRNALNGIYREMSSQSMYGKEMSWGMVDVMGQCYRTGTGIGSTNVYYQAGYDGVYTSENSKGMISGMWSSTYNVIANCNNLIEKITKAEPKEFRGGNLEKEMILGEATALRGFLHFDMLRLFGKAPVKGENELAIPYFTRFKSVFEPTKTTKEILDLVIADLKKGRDLVINFDTLTVDGVDRKTWMSRMFRFNEKWGETSIMPTDIFYGFRGYRMNHLAITAVLARVYNYAQKHDLAVEEASKVINYAINIYQQAFVFTPRADVAGDRKLSSDVIFSLSDNEVYKNFDLYTNSEKYHVEFLINISYTDNIGFDDKEDYRRKDLLTANKSGSYYIPNKHIAPTVPSPTSEQVADMLPMIRLSEMHYITAEAYASKNDFVKAAEALDQVRAGRNCKTGILKITDKSSFETELIKEVKREFVCEGQAFFYYKKLNILPRTKFSESVFVLPLPENENVN